MSVVGIGNALVDILIQIPSDDILAKLDLPKGSMTLIDFEKHMELCQAFEAIPRTLAAGGSAANTINGLAKLNTQTAFIGKIGNDPTGEEFRRDQINSNITPVLQISNDTPTGKCISFVSHCGERTMATYLGAAATMQAPQIEELDLRGNKILYVEGYLLYNESLIEQALKQAKDQGLTVALDMASYNVVADKRELLTRLIRQYVDIIFANEDEAREFTGQEPQQAIEQLSHLCQVAIVKIGAKGSLIASGTERYTIGVIQATPCDKTGAGDLYAAGFLYGYCRNYPLKMAGDIGAILSSKVVEVMGPKMTDQQWVEITDLVRRIEHGEDLVVF